MGEHLEMYAVDVHPSCIRLRNPKLHELDRELSFRVVELGPGYYVAAAHCLRRLGFDARSRPVRRGGEAAPEEHVAAQYLLASPSL
jgi:hypothetical protein